MKKLLLSLLFLIPVSSFAQKGMQGVGVNFGMGFAFEEIVDFEGFASDFIIKYQKSLTDKFRIVSTFGLYDVEVVEYDLDQDDYFGRTETCCFFGIEGNYFLNDVRRLRPYVIGGVVFGYCDDPYSVLGGGVKLGLGLDFRLGYHFTTQLELPYCMMYPRSCFIPSLGLVYTF